MPLKIVFGFGNPPSQLLVSIHHQVTRFQDPPNYYYQPVNLEIPSIEKSFGILQSSHVLGCHFAESIQINNFDWLDRLGPGALSSGRVNVVYKEQKQIIGEDTLLSGSLRALQGAGFRIEGSRVLLLGSGFEAQSIARSLAILGMKQLLVLHSSVDRVRAMASALKRDVPSLSVMIGSLLTENMQEIIGNVDLLINAIDPNDLQSRAFWPASLSLPQQLLIFDLIPDATRPSAPQDTVRYIDAHTLLLWQNAECYRLWNRQDPPLDLLRQVISDVEPNLL